MIIINHRSYHRHDIFQQQQKLVPKMCQENLFGNHHESKTTNHRLNKIELLKSLDKDFSHVKKEMTLFEIVNRGTYREYFIAIIANCLFCIFCANILYKFYSFIGKREKVIERQQFFKQTKHQMKNGDRIMEYLSVYGYQILTK
ncbi:hypothetical protein DERF_009802 [Dermatophagoides farinae]|uniref:Transmembrane protein n=1 Tax=Dermatophagoides farinae TaxID=6954 RepID=A0A922HXM9_DERFA|nr:hypothetical protein DERF_009802 [Dermatophagoides farinae]